MKVPSEFSSGYDAIRSSNPELTDAYMANMTVGDPLADRVIEELAGLDQKQVGHWIEVMMDANGQDRSGVPRVLREFFDGVLNVPEWYRSVPVEPGCSAFFRNSDLFVLAFASSTVVRGFCTTIAVSFFTTGRLIDAGKGRLRHNLRHLVEIMLPGGLDPYGDGWKLAIRTRLVHARVRKLIDESNEWDHGAYGLPVCASHIALSSAAFSAMLVQDAVRLGAQMSEAERASFIHVWRCSSWLMGVPDDLLFHSEAEGHELLRVGLGCEPPVGPEGIIMAHSLINSVPHVIGMEGEADKRKMIDRLFRLSRRMIGDRHAEDLRLPRKVSAGMIALVKLQRRFQKIRGKLPLFHGLELEAQNLLDLLDRSRLVDEEEQGLNYKLPQELSSYVEEKFPEVAAQETAAEAGA